MMDAKYFEEIKAREQAATPGLWRASGDIEHLVCAEEDAGKYNGPPIVADCGHLYNASNSFHVRQMQDNATFISHARTDIPALIAEVERLTKSNNIFAEENHTLYQQIATLKKALEMAAEHINRLTKESDCRMKPNSEYCADTISCIDCIQRRFICQAQEQEANHE